ncbi:MAG: hypothetical protein R3C05_32020, partial [Pirellulaceae bacterium]
MRLTRILAIARRWNCVAGALLLMTIDCNSQDLSESPTSASVPAKSDSAVAAKLFNEQHVPESGFSVFQRSASASPQERYEILQAWVVPDRSTARFRVTVDFAPGEADAVLLGTEGDQSTHKHARVISPASELIRLASELNHADSLRSMIEACPPGIPTEELNRNVLLALLAIETDDDEIVNTLLTQWLEKLQASPELLNHSTAGLVLLAQTAIDHENRLPLVREVLRLAVYAHRAEYNRKADLRHLVALAAKLEAEEKSMPFHIGTTGNDDSNQWHLVELERAFEHGEGFPVTLWELQQGRYRNLSNYGDALLFFQSPLLGDYSVEATATGFGYRESHLIVGGHWTGLVYNHKELMFGDPRSELSRQPLAPPLNDTTRYGFIRTQVDIEDQTASTFMNGRFVHQAPIAQDDSP